MAINLAPSEPARLDWHALAARVASRAAAPARASTRDAQFVELQAAYRHHGGIARDDEMVANLRLYGDGGYLELARQLVAGQVFSFHWHESIWLPLFQFDAARMTLREAPRRVLDELRGALEGWDLAHWHVRPHPVLALQRPSTCSMPTWMRCCRWPAATASRSRAEARSVRPAT